MVFDNSIAVITKEEKEMFFTSFVFRDNAYELLTKMFNEENDSIKSSNNNSN